MTSPCSLSSRSQFAAVFSQGRRSRRDGVTVWALPQPAGGVPRLGLSVGTRTGGAVARNRMCRRLRAIFRRAPLRPADVVVKVDRSAMAASFQELESSLLAALTSTGVVSS